MEYSPGFTSIAYFAQVVKRLAEEAGNVVSRIAHQYDTINDNLVVRVTLKTGTEATVIVPRKWYDTHSYVDLEEQLHEKYPELFTLGTVETEAAMRNDIEDKRKAMADAVTAWETAVNKLVNFRTQTPS